MKIHVCVCPPFDTNAYLVMCSETSQKILIDAGQNSYSFAKKHGGVQAVFLTHSHQDHTAEAYLFEKDSIDIYVHEKDLENLFHPGSDGIFFPTNVPAIKNVRVFENSFYSVGNLEFQVIETPGHSPGSVCFYFKEQEVLFSGDTLFRGGPGRFDFPTSSFSDLQASLRMLIQLPLETKVYPGHFATTTIRKEKDWILTF